MQGANTRKCCRLNPHAAQVSNYVDCILDEDLKEVGRYPSITVEVTTGKTERPLIFNWLLIARARACARRSSSRDSQIFPRNGPAGRGALIPRPSASKVAASMKPREHQQQKAASSPAMAKSARRGGKDGVAVKAEKKVKPRGVSYSRV